MNNRADSIALAEQQVAEARLTAFVEFDAARASVRRHVRSPVLIGGVLLGAVALGYLAFRHGKRRRRADSSNPDPWAMATRTVQVLVPLLMALVSTTRAGRGRRAEGSGTAR